MRFCHETRARLAGYLLPGLCAGMWVTGCSSSDAAGGTQPALEHGGCGEECGAMVEVPAGSFWMGASTNGVPCPSDQLDPSAEAAELPCHLVDVPRFAIDKYETTVSQYANCVAAGDCSVPVSQWELNWGKPSKEQHPVNGVSWAQAKAYCAFRDERLCSEAEWEKAARGTDGRVYPWGNQEATCQYAVMNDGDWASFCGMKGTLPVGSVPAGASPYGALDLAGNVFEWVEDGYHADFNGAPVDGSAWEDSNADTIVVKGGSFLTYRHYLRASFRAPYPRESFVDVDLGFRCCR